jgi:hypothetical protein
MASDSESRFHFECEGIEVEITGDRAFVEKMYRQIMRDLDRARPSEESIQSDDPDEPEGPYSNRVVWVISCSEMLQRVYMTEAANIEASPLSRALDPEGIGSLYIERDTFADLLPDVADREATLWAQLTEAGRRRIAGESES